MPEIMPAVTGIVIILLLILKLPGVRKAFSRI